MVVTVGGVAVVAGCGGGDVVRVGVVVGVVTGLVVVGVVGLGVLGVVGVVVAVAEC